MCIPNIEQMTCQKYIGSATLQGKNKGAIEASELKLIWFLNTKNVFSEVFSVEILSRIVYEFKTSSGLLGVLKLVFSSCVAAVNNEFCFLWAQNII